MSKNLKEVINRLLYNKFTFFFYLFTFPFNLYGLYTFFKNEEYIKFEVIDWIKFSIVIIIIIIYPIAYLRRKRNIGE